MSNGINETRHLGNLTRDPELKYTPSGKAVARFTIACNYPVKEGNDWTQGVDFITYIAWEGIAEVAGKYLRKGSKVLVDGRVKPRSYEKDGSTVYVIDLVVSKLRMLDSRPRTQDAAPPQGQTQDNRNVPPVVPADNPEITDEDIPF